MTNGLTVLPPYPNSGSASPARNRNIHAEMVKILDQAPGWERIASYYGTVGSPPIGTGLDATDQAAPSGEQAWAVWRSVSGSNTFDIAIKWSWNAVYTAGQFNLGTSNWGVGITVAHHSSSQAWNGTTDNDGADTFSSGTPWKSGSLIFPRQNANGGAGAAEGSRDYMGGFSVSLHETGNMISAVDNDNVFFAFNHTSVDNTTGRHTIAFYFGKYVPEPDANITLPYIYFCTGNSAIGVGELFVPIKSYGRTAKDNNDNHGVSFSSSSIPDVSTFVLSHDLTATSNSGTLSITSGSVLQEYPFYILLNENPTPGDTDVKNTGTLGRIDFVRAVRSSDVANLDRVDNDTKLILSRSWTVALTARSAPPSFITIPWISGTLMPTGSSTNKTSNFVLRATGSGESLSAWYRGEDPPGTFVYSLGSPPVGASNIVIIGFV